MAVQRSTAFVRKLPPLERLEVDVEAMRRAMREASRIVLGGFPLETEAKIIRYPDRYYDKRGKEMFTKVMQLLGAVK
jgi:hypothetical protein